MVSQHHSLHYVIFRSSTVQRGVLHYTKLQITRCHGDLMVPINLGDWYAYLLIERDPPVTVAFNKSLPEAETSFVRAWSQHLFPTEQAGTQSTSPPDIGVFRHVATISGFWSQKHELVTTHMHRVRAQHWTKQYQSIHQHGAYLGLGSRSCISCDWSLWIHSKKINLLVYIICSSVAKANSQQCTTSTINWILSP